MRDQLDKLSIGIGQDRQTPRDRGQAGYAMLLVFLMAACVAITLYVEVPRVAFEAERQRELRLVDRGNQFKRAIQVFVTETHLYPTSLEALERSNNHRYLRRRYADPMTGKNEWRLVHFSGGVLTDSVTTQANSANAAGWGQPGTPGGPANGQQQAAQPCTASIGGCPATTSGQPSAQQPPQIASGGIPPGDAVGAPDFNTSDGAQGDAQSSAQPAASTMIGNLLTTPRPGGMPSNMPARIAGIAGVASKYEAEGIMVINQRRKINEWEFIFDPIRYRAPPNPVTGTVGTPQR